MINENGYRDLSRKDFEIVENYNSQIDLKSIDNINDLKIYEINSIQIKNILKTHSYTWIHLWRPYCSNKNCQLIDYYSHIEEKYLDWNVAFLLISESYDLFSIEKSLNSNPYSGVIYVLSDSYYGHKLPEIRNKFISDLTNNENIAINISYLDFVFKDTSFIYASESMQIELLDSLLASSHF